LIYERKEKLNLLKKEIDAFADKPITMLEGIDMENHVIATITLPKNWTRQ
jgi:hypothetical protein